MTKKATIKAIDNNANIAKKDLYRLQYKLY